MTAARYYYRPVNHRRPSGLRALLLLLLAAGPLQAQATYACAMMDTVVHDACCCEGPKVEDDCGNPGCDATLESGEGPCCERSVEVTVDQESGQDALTAKPTEVRSDVDPPPALVCSPDALFPPRPFPTRAFADRLAGTGQSGSDTWLLTQRLRI